MSAHRTRDSIVQYATLDHEHPYENHFVLIAFFSPRTLLQIH
jgi:hypothetical protein